MTNEDFPILKKSYRVTMGDGSVWAVPVSEIAVSRASHYMSEFGGDLVKSLYEDTLPLFQEDEKQIKEWACGNMDWSDVMSIAVRIEQRTEIDRYAKDWVNPTKTELK